MAESFESLVQPDGEKTQKVWPTLFVGLGGTGMEVAQRVRRRILNYVWGSPGSPVRISALSEFPLAQFINFDLDAGSVAASGQAAATDPLDELVKFTDEEKLIFKLDMEKYLRTDGELAKYPHIASWFPISRKKAVELKIDPSKGAGQIRALSRLYFFDKYPALRAMLEDKTRRLLQGASNDAKEKRDRLGLELEPASLRVVVVASTAGGTGSGSLLDMGYLSKWVANKALKGAKVDLMVMLPSGYAGHGKSRTEANTYAALMEMESCIGGGLQLAEGGWKGGESLELPSRPYDEIYLFDTGNLALEKTDRAEDLFDMVADILFEDFTSQEFANRKRSIAVNQQQYKLNPFDVPVDTDKYGAMKLSYTKAYSAFGQAIIDTQLEQRRDEIACKQVNDMLRVFFGVAGDSEAVRKVPPPTPDDARAVLKAHAYCGADTFTLAYKFVSDANPYVEGLQHQTLKLVESLLYEGDKPMLGRLHDRISREVAEILASTEKDQRLPLVEKLKAQLDRELGLEGGAADAGAGGLEKAVNARRDVVFHSLVADESGLQKALWAAVDNKEKGGLDYAAQLVSRMKDEIESERTGLLHTLETSMKWFSGLCEKIRVGEFDTLREHIGQTRGGWFGGNKAAHAEAKLQQIGETLRWYVEARVRALACQGAMVVLRRVSTHLGEHRGFDERTGRKHWSAESFAGRLAAFERLIINIMASTDQEVVRTREGTKHAHAAYQVIPASTAELDAARNIDPKQAMEWAQSVFENKGGSRVLFEELAQDESRVKLLRQLRNLALQKLPPIGGGEHNPLIIALDDMPETRRKDVFEQCLKMAMPWMEADLEGDWTVDPDQYACVVGVSGKDVFERRFGDAFLQAIPGRARMSPGKVKFYETGVAGKLTCYVELSGIPLTALSLLSNWRESYEEQDVKIPVHTHKDKTLFQHPMAPSVARLDRLADHFKLYLQGVVLGVLKPRARESVYCIKVMGEELSIGGERNIRQDGISLDHLDYVKKKVGDALDHVKTAVQWAGLAAAYEYCATRVYPPAKVERNRRETLISGFGNVLSMQLKENAVEALRRKAANAGIDADVLFGRAIDAMELWTVEIEGSERDAYAGEIGTLHTAKRVVRPEFFDPQWLEQRVGTERKSEAIPVQGVSATSKIMGWWVAVEGQKYGPHDREGLEALLARGKLRPDSKVWKKGVTPSWVRAIEAAELSFLFDEPPPLDDEPPPLD